MLELQMVRITKSSIEIRIIDVFVRRFSGDLKMLFELANVRLHDFELDRVDCIQNRVSLNMSNWYSYERRLRMSYFPCLVQLFKGFASGKVSLRELHGEYLSQKAQT